MQGHGGTRLQISEFEKSTGHMGVVIEESEVSVLEFWELLFTGVAGIVLQFVVQEVD
jgi:hypothetical protein